MELIDNINLLLGDDLKQTLKPGARLKIAASCFSMYAFEALVGSRTIGYLKTSVRCCMAERYFEKFWQHGKPVPRSCHADQSS